jgi:hypothetical protein
LFRASFEWWQIKTDKETMSSQAKPSQDACVVLALMVVHLRVHRVAVVRGAPLVIKLGLPCGRELLRPGQRNAEAPSRAAATVPGGDHWSAANVACVHQLLYETPSPRIPAA